MSAELMGSPWAATCRSKRLSTRLRIGATATAASSTATIAEAISTLLVPVTTRRSTANQAPIAAMNPICDSVAAARPASAPGPASRKGRRTHASFASAMAAAVMINIAVKFTVSMAWKRVGCSGVPRAM